MVSAKTFPSTCPLISIETASIDPRIDPSSLTTKFETKTFPLTKPETSTPPEDLISPSICSVSPTSDLPLGFKFLILFF